MLGMMNVCPERSHSVACSFLSLMAQNLTESTVRLQGSTQDFNTVFTKIPINDLLIIRH